MAALHCVAERARRKSSCRQSLSRRRCGVFSSRKFGSCLESGSIESLVETVLEGQIMHRFEYYSATKPSGCFQLELVVDLNNQTKQVSNDGARVSAWVGDVGQLRQWLFEDAKTLYEGFRRGARVSNTGDCLGWRTATGGSEKENDPMPYRWISYNDVIRRSEALARGFVSKGLAVGQQTVVGIYSKNRPEWIITEQACYVYNMVLVPLYDTLGPDACSFVISQTEMKLVVVENSNKAEALLAKRAQCPTLTMLAMIETVEPGLRDRAAAIGLEIVQLAKLEQRGNMVVDVSPPPLPPSPEDLCTISYTSGTTGNPKGVMLTHGNVVADVCAISPLKYAVPDATFTLFSFLPLAHMFERLLQAALYMFGGRAGFYRGDIKLLMDDVKELKPTIMAVVPRVLNRAYDRVMQKASKRFLGRWVLQKAVEWKTKQLEQRIVRNDSLWDRYVFSEVREAMGGNLRLMFTGSAPIGNDVLTFFRCALGCVILEGYGQTECVAAATMTLEGDHTLGHVGAPVPCVQVKLVDVPEMDYYAKDGVGEVCFKGYNVFKGYFKEPERTAEALDAGGWLHSGDVGRWTPSGALKLVDRKKNMFKLSQGEYISPEKLENIFVRSRFLGQAFVCGESLKSVLVPIVAPDPEVLPTLVETELGVRGTMAELCENEKVKKAILDDMISEGKKAGLLTFELPNDIFLHPEPFTVESGLLTPTMKMKRAMMKDRFKAQIEEMYRALP